jgi:hypothetical protein
MIAWLMVLIKILRPEEGREKSVLDIFRTEETIFFLGGSTS